MVKVKVFILNKRGNILRYLKESRTERKESRLDMARALCEREENNKRKEELAKETREQEVNKRGN